RLEHLLSATPQDVNSNLWHRVVYCSPAPEKLRKPLDWFVPRFPSGTAYDFAARNFDADPDISVADLAKLRSLNPCNRALVFSWISAKYPHHTFTDEQLSTAYGALADVDVSAMQKVADAIKGNQAKYNQQIEKMARYKPDLYFQLGDAYLKQKQPEMAK